MVSDSALSYLREKAEDIPDEEQSEQVVDMDKDESAGIAAAAKKLDLRWLNIPKLDKLLLERRALYDYDFRTYFKRDMTQLYIDKMAYQTRMGQNATLNFYGQPGSVKSYAGMSTLGMVYEYLIKLGLRPPAPTTETIFFRLEDIDAYLPKLKIGSTIMVDERVQVYGVGTKRLDAEYILMMETLRKRKINFYIIAPIPRARRHAYFLIKGMRLTDYKTVAYCELQDVDMGCIGHLKFPHPALLKSIGKKFVDAYEKKKDEFLDSVQRKRSIDYLRVFAEEVIKTKKFKEMESIYEDLAAEKKMPFRGVPHRVLIEMVNDKYPDLRRNIECVKVADHIFSVRVLEHRWLPKLT